MHRAVPRGTVPKKATTARLAANHTHWGHKQVYKELQTLQADNQPKRTSQTNPTAAPRTTLASDAKRLHCRTCNARLAACTTLHTDAPTDQHAGSHDKAHIETNGNRHPTHLTYALRYETRNRRPHETWHACCGQCSNKYSYGVDK